MVSSSNSFKFNGIDPFDDWSTSNGELRGYYPRNSLINLITKAHSDGIGVYSNTCVIRSNVKIIKRSCFRNNERFGIITLSEGIETIEDYSFWNMRLKDIGIPRSVKKIAKNAFSKDMVLSVYKGSYAEKYAIKNGFKYDYYQEGDE